MRKLTLAAQILLIVFSGLLSKTVFAAPKDSIRFVLSVPDPGAHIFHVTMTCTSVAGKPLSLKLPQWTPGYYQLMNYAGQISAFTATDAREQPLQVTKTSGNTWSVITGKSGPVTLGYDVAATRAFVATSYTDSAHAYITPASAFVYPDGRLQTPVSLTVVPFKGWSRVACGLDSVSGTLHSFTAPGYDMLYDCPILMGNLEELTPFKIQGIPHRFIGYKLGDFDKPAFMSDLERVVKAGVDIIGDIPYKHYTFLAIGPGNGGIEHLTSSALSFGGNLLGSPERKKRTLSFIAHEYFHHYNVKRIRPVELGPFNYDSGSRTKQLWISEGWTVYYEYLLLKRARLIDDSDLYKYFTANIRAYETGAGRHYQSLAQSSEETWSDGPFGRKGEEVNKTISYYDKGPVVALMLDFAIRHHTQNKQSLDAVMRRLYHDFYKQKNRGFTETEFRKVCEQIAGKDLSEIFDYVYTTKELNYGKYFGYGGLAIDTVSALLPGGYSNLSYSMQRDTLTITKVDWPSAAWDAGIRPGAKILLIDGKQATSAVMDRLKGSSGITITCTLLQEGKRFDVPVTFVKKTDRSFLISPLPEPDALQREILKSWGKGK